MLHGKTGIQYIVLDGKTGKGKYVIHARLYKTLAEANSSAHYRNVIIIWKTKIGRREAIRCVKWNTGIRYVKCYLICNSPNYVSLSMYKWLIKLIAL